MRHTIVWRQPPCSCTKQCQDREGSFICGEGAYCSKGEKQLKISRDSKHGMKPGNPLENFIAVVIHSGA